MWYLTNQTRSMKQEQSCQYDHPIGADNRTNLLSAPLKRRSSWSWEEIRYVCEVDRSTLFTSGCGWNIRDGEGRLTFSFACRYKMNKLSVHLQVKFCDIKTSTFTAHQRMVLNSEVLISGKKVEAERLIIYFISSPSATFLHFLLSLMSLPSYLLPPLSFRFHSSHDTATM